MPTEPRQLHLNAFLMNVGHHEAAWRHPRTDPSSAHTAAHFVNLARIAERGKLNSIFFADGSGLSPAVRWNTQGGLDPLSILEVVSAHTSRIGLIATVSTSFHEPFNLARRLASLDVLSDGRAGWNIVTSGTDLEARNFGYDAHAPHSQRYARADEFLDIVTKLWDSWEDDALTLDREGGLYADTDRVRAIRHEGRYFRVDGALTVPRSPQGYPVLVQAGSSDAGKDFAARWAEAVFTAQQTLADGQAFYADLKSRLAAHGRRPEQLLVLPGISPILGSTEAEALALQQELEDLLVPEYGLAQLSGMVGVPLGLDDLDRPLPDVPPEADINGNKSRRTLVVDLARRESLTVRQIIARLAGGRGHRVIAGTPEQVADSLEEWFTHGAADGFNVMAPVLPSGLEDFVDHVVPILQAKGLFRTDYTGTTLRDHYRLERPRNRLVSGLSTSEPDAGAIAAVPLSRIGLNRQGPLDVRDAPFGSVGRAAQAGATPG